MTASQSIGERKLIDRVVPDDSRWGPMEGFVATTYDLSPEFLETDFLPSVFGLGTWDDRSWATRVALEKRLCELDGAVILTEARRYRGRPRSLRLEVQPVSGPHGSALHAKVTLLLFERAVRLIVGSANLTERGYRRNREVVAVLTASAGAKKEAALISEALAGMELALAPWLSAEAKGLIRRSLERLQPWTIGPASEDTAFLKGQSLPNIEAGLLLRRSVQSSTLDGLIPDLVGSPVLLTSSNFHALRAPDTEAGDAPWPDFISQAVLSPVAKGETELELRIEIAPARVPPRWSAKLADKEGIPAQVLISIDTTQDASISSYRLSLSPETLTSLLTEQELLICWDEYPLGRLIPLNVESSARALLPISPGNQRIEESHLLSYYQGRILWEDLFPEPDVPIGQTGTQTQPTSPTSVDKSQIQSYQIREFVEALAGIRADLKGATRSEASMRLALLGPVSPCALADTVLEAVKSGHRTPTAAGFQMVEILACLRSAHAEDVPEKLAESWKLHLADATKRITRLLREFSSSHQELATNKAFRRYQNAVLAGGRKADL